MAFFHQLNRMARTLGDLNKVMEFGKSISSGLDNNSPESSSGVVDKSASEYAAAQEQFKRIGEHYYNIYASGGEVAPEVLEACQLAKAHIDAAQAAQAHTDDLLCPQCGTHNHAQSRFCCACGSKLETDMPRERFCPQCGTAVAQGRRFCGECGSKVDE